MNKFLKNQPTWALKNMVIALNIHSWLNTEEEKKRLKDAKFILKTRAMRKQNGK